MSRTSQFLIIFLVIGFIASAQAYSADRCYVLDNQGTRQGWIVDRHAWVADRYSIYRPDRPGQFFADADHPAGAFDIDTGTVFTAVYVKQGGYLQRIMRDAPVGRIGINAESAHQMFNLDKRLVGFIDTETKDIIKIQNGAHTVVGKVQEGENCDLSKTWNIQKAAATAFRIFIY